MNDRNRPLTDDERNALLAFKAEYGREWKQYLMAAWLSYAYKGRQMGGKDTGILRSIRNEFGPTWLTKLKL
jgi:hypothetical protein